jgi:hypothetical protein
MENAGSARSVNLVLDDKDLDRMEVILDELGQPEWELANLLTELVRNAVEVGAKNLEHRARLAAAAGSTGGALAERARRMRRLAS